MSDHDDTTSSNVAAAAASPAKPAGATASSPAAGFGSPAPAGASSPLDAAKHLDFGGKGSAPATPVTPAIGKTAAEALTYDDWIRDTLLWKNKVRSSVYLVGGLLAVLAVQSILASSTPIVTGVCYLLLAQIALNSARASVDATRKFTWGDSVWTAVLVDRLTGAVKAAASIHDVHLSGVNPTKTLQISVFLWLLSMVARHVPATLLLLLVHVGAFSLPVAYASFKAKVDEAVGQAVDKAKTEFSRLDRRLKAALILLPTLSVGYLFSRADLLAAIAITIVYARFALKPAEMQKLAHGMQRGAGPITGAASTVGHKLGAVVSTYATKYELTPLATPSRKKTQ